MIGVDLHGLRELVIVLDPRSLDDLILCRNNVQEVLALKGVVVRGRNVRISSQTTSNIIK
jgi:hypothetical protein